MTQDTKLHELDGGRRVAIEMGTQLQIEVEGVASRLKSHLVGMDLGKYLILDLSHVNLSGGVRHKLFKRNTVVVRYIYSGKVYGFQSYILGATTDPAKLLFVAYPKVVAENNIRKSYRVESHLPARIKANEIEVEATLIDISQTGCKCQIKQSRLKEAKVTVEVNKEINLLTVLPGIQEELNLTGFVRNLNKDTSEVTFGMEFYELDSQAENSLLHYLSAIMTARE